MNCCKQNKYAQSGRAALQLVALGLLLAGASLANAALITGSMGVGGVFGIDAGSNFESTTTLTFDTVEATSDGLGDLGTISVGDTAIINNDTLTIRPVFSPQTDVFQIGGFQFDIDSLSTLPPSFRFAGRNLADRLSAVRLTISSATILS